MSVTYYQSGKLKRLQTFPQLVRGETIKGIRRAMHGIRRSAALTLRERSIGRALFGYAMSGAYKNIKRLPIREGPTGLFDGGLLIDGVASIQERGGAIKPHMIRGKGSLKAKVGRISTIMGKTYFKGSVVSAYQHPGVRAMPAFPFVDKAVAENRGIFRAQIDKAMANVAAVVNGG